jgi:hypothetical protein
MLPDENLIQMMGVGIFLCFPQMTHQEIRMFIIDESSQ